MGSEIIRPDWGPGGDRALATSLPGETTGNVAAVREATASLLPAAGEDAYLSEMAGSIGQGIFEQHGCPDPVGFENELKKLPQQDLDLLDSILKRAKAGDDHVDVLLAYERKATIPQLLRAREWFRQMPATFQEWFREASP